MPQHPFHDLFSRNSLVAIYKSVVPFPQRGEGKLETRSDIVRNEAKRCGGEGWAFCDAQKTMTALELILLELILVPGLGSQFACVHNNETRSAARCRAPRRVVAIVEGVEASKAKPTTITRVSGSKMFNPGSSMGRLSLFFFFFLSSQSPVMKFN